MTRLQIACRAAALSLSMVSLSVHGAEGLPTPGPESEGLRLRLTVESQHVADGDEFRVRLDLINVTDAPVTVSGVWPFGLDGSFSEYMEGATSIRAFPEITLWGIQVSAERQPSPVARHTLAAGETLTVHWETRGHRLKHRVIRPLSNRNPYFPSDGLYGIHAELRLDIEKAAGSAEEKSSSREAGQSVRHPVRLRSNEQLVPVGGSNHAPKTSITTVRHINEDLTEGEVSAGFVDGIKPGDRFLVRTGMAVFWKLTVTEVHADYSRVKVERDPFHPGVTSNPRAHEWLKHGERAGLMPAGVEGMDWMWVHH